MFSILVRLGLLAGFVAMARRILARDAPPPPRLAPPSGAKGKPRETPARRVA